MRRDEQAIIRKYQRCLHYGASDGKALMIAAMSCAYSVREVELLLARAGVRNVLRDPATL